MRRVHWSKFSNQKTKRMVWDNLGGEYMDDEIYELIHTKKPEVKKLIIETFEKQQKIDKKNDKTAQSKKRNEK
eukprot:UN17568